ncbi:MAG TPA: hypothetical protein VLA34_09100, partial [Candidatus Krumholzibacterium sp.]|nr:hypothetical protein [Candidatus Krumholzibacterium sp.]
MAQEGRGLIDLYAASRLVADGQKRIAALLGGMLEAGKLSPSLIFTGPEGSGKQLMALWLGARLNCESRAPTAEPGLGLDLEQAGPSGGGATGHPPAERCAACEKASKLEHPDLHIVFPMPSGPPDKSLPVIIESRREDFLAEGEFSGKARSIGI